MRFKLGAVEFDTDRMEKFDTGDLLEPTVYIDSDRRVFVITVMGGTKTIRRAFTPEVHELLAKHEIRPLEQTLQIPSAELPVATFQSRK